MNDQMVNIKQALKDAGITQSEIAVMLGVSPAAVNYVVVRKKKIPRICKAISMAIGKQVTDIWPEGKSKKQKTPPAPADQNNLVDGEDSRALDPNRG